eukprot:364059-Chlamydomonas_euryale.AAC.8
MSVVAAGRREEEDGPGLSAGWTRPECRMDQALSAGWTRPGPGLSAAGPGLKGHPTARLPIQGRRPCHAHALH